AAGVTTCRLLGIPTCAWRRAPMADAAFDPNPTWAGLKSRSAAASWKYAIYFVAKHGWRQQHLTSIQNAHEYLRACSALPPLLERPGPLDGHRHEMPTACALHADRRRMGEMER